MVVPRRRLRISRAVRPVMCGSVDVVLQVGTERDKHARGVCDKGGLLYWFASRMVNSV
jgi:hypothetical protein